MNKEIERKFLIDPTWKTQTQALNFKMISQGYLSYSNPVVRVRTSNDIGLLTIKGNGVKGELGVDEYEYNIPIADAERMLRTLCGKVITKVRYLIDVGDHTWEIDEFLGEHEGLLFAEIELKSEDEVFEKPSWILEEVTGDRRFYNNFIIGNPITIKNLVKSIKDNEFEKWESVNG